MHVPVPVPESSLTEEVESALSKFSTVEEMAPDKEGRPIDKTYDLEGRSSPCVFNLILLDPTVGVKFSVF